MKKELSTFLFDFDGTLVDSHDSLVRVFVESYKAVGVTISEKDIWHLMRVRLQDGYKDFNAPEDKFYIFGESILKLLNDEETVKMTKVYDDVIDTLIGLKKQGKTLGIVTSNNVRHVKDVLTHLGISLDLFSVYVGNEQTKNHKPFPDPILKGIEMLGIENSGICYVGDGLDDIKSAIAANVTPILLDRMNEYSEEMCIVIKTLGELL